MAIPTSISQWAAVAIIAVNGCGLASAQAARVRDLGLLGGATIEGSLRSDDEVVILHPNEVGAVGVGRTTAAVIAEIRRRADIVVLAEVVESSGVEASDHTWVNTRLVTYVYDVLWRTGQA